MGNKRKYCKLCRFPREHSQNTATEFMLYLHIERVAKVQDIYMTEIQGKSILFRFSEGSSLWESTVYLPQSTIIPVSDDFDKITTRL